MRCGGLSRAGSTLRLNAILTIPAQVWVLDSNPGLLPKDKSDVARVMNEVGDIKMPVRSRDAAMAHLEVRSSLPILQLQPL